MISIRNLEKNFGDNVVLAGIDLDICRGETLVVMGRSGCGKSVLLKNITGLIKPDRGQILFKGDNVTTFTREELFKMRMSFGMLFQGSALFDSMSVGENVALPLVKHTDLTDDEIEKRVIEKLDLVGLADVTEKHPAELSGGMKKRVALARAVVMDPEVVLYDEPTTGLDPVMAGVINRLILNLQKNLDITSIVVTHDIQSAYMVGDCIAMLHDGRIIFQGNPEQVQRTENETIKIFINGGSYAGEGMQRE
ncbi:MAG: ATP-binding cassette domain-containing protein [Candidatus Latescibacteria bacterium]|nr:ATP-binding cassette domain-containing protein [bacterium]MBD3423497.1 ATP-binding cassette domain-containing protein [Candidatus Latescibacterota bacterium]